jgi:Cytochrome P450
VWLPLAARRGRRPDLEERVLPILVLIGCLLTVASLPYWLPPAIVRLRMRLFAHVNGDEGIPVPGDLVGAAHFKELYSHPAANGRSRGAALSDLFWYWLSPGAEIHQEHLEPGERYEEVAGTTRRILGMSRAEAETLAARCSARVLGEAGAARGARLVRLRDLMMPVFAEFYYEVAFGERCPPHARALIVANAGDVATALQCCGLRHMDRRDRLTRYLVQRLTTGAPPHDLPAGMTTRERALYLQGTFFNTAVVQTSEAMAHLLMVLARHPEAQARVRSDDRYLDRVMEETFRLYPLFGIAHRITSAEITLDGGQGPGITIPAGSVLCFNYPAYHRVGFTDPERFDPSRWETASAREASHIPFGVAANRPCPAWRLAPITMRVTARELLSRFAVYTWASHTRSMPNRGPCVLVPRDGRPGPRPSPGPGPRALLVYVWLRDRWEDVARSFVQLVLGTYMVWDARRQRLCERHFETVDRHAQVPTARG